MPFRITVTEIKFPSEPANAPPSITEIYAQMVEELDIRKFAVQVNKPARGRKAKGAKE